MAEGLLKEQEQEQRQHAFRQRLVDMGVRKTTDEREQVEGLRKMYEMQAWKKKADGIAAPSAPTWTASRPFA